MKLIDNYMQKGFSIIESLIAISIMSAGLVGVILIIQEVGAYGSNYIFNLTAAYLAQEGIEVVRNIRDNNVISGNNWTNGITLNASDYRLDYRSNKFPDDSNCPSGYNYLDISGGFYKCSNNSSSTFQRLITVTSVAAEELKVKVEVSWLRKGKDYSVEAEERIYKHPDI